MEQGAPFEAALRYVREQGISEADASLDLDGWDAAIKLSLLVQA
jgi:homoserine dehydrogenase